jgi:hypothetical protein
MYGISIKAASSTFLPRLIFPQKTEGCEEALFRILGGFVNITATLIFEGGFVEISAGLIIKGVLVAF